MASSSAEHTGAFLAYLEQKRPHVEAWLLEHTQEALPEEPCAADLESYLYGPLASFNQGGGKRIRPILAILACEALGGDESTVLATACSIELFQSAALIHDDIADKSELRRGLPALHTSLGEGLAINVGDAALVQVSDTILSDEQLSTAKKLEVLRLIVEMEQRTLEGQALDLGWVKDRRWDISVADYLSMASHKTAYYSAATPLMLGALCAGAKKHDRDILGAFGMEVGFAFQLADDLLNLTGDPNEQGKDFLSDLVEGKRTMIVVRALECLKGAEHLELIELLEAHTHDEEKLARALELIQKTDALEYVRAYAQESKDHAICQLDLVELDESLHEVLVGMANFFVERTH